MKQTMTFTAKVTITIEIDPEQESRNLPTMPTSADAAGYYANGITDRMRNAVRDLSNYGNPTVKISIPQEV